MKNNIQSVRLALIFFAYLNLTACSENNQKSKEIDSLGYIYYKINDDNFNVPNNYRYGANLKKYKTQAKTGDVRLKVNSFLVRALLPDIVPWSEENNHEFTRKGFGKKISISVNLHDGQGKTQKEYLYFLNKYNRLTEDIIDEKVEGINHYTDKRTPTNGDKRKWVDLFLKDEDFDVPFFKIICYRKRHNNYYPYCTVISMYSKSIYLTYSYGREHIANWKEIDRSVKKLITKFKMNQ